MSPDLLRFDQVTEMRDTDLLFLPPLCQDRQRRCSRVTAPDVKADREEG
jgi:hypothetical protein